MILYIKKNPKEATQKTGRANKYDVMYEIPGESTQKETVELIKKLQQGCGHKIILRKCVCKIREI